MSDEQTHRTAGRYRGREITVDLLFYVGLALVSELVVQVSGWSRLPVLFAVFVVGHLVRGALGGRPGARSTRAEVARSDR